MSTLIPEGAHSLLGPSSADRWMNCPGSVAATRHLPDEKSRFAAEGTAAHTLSEWCRQQNKPARDWHGQELVVGEHSFVVDQEMADSVQEFVDYTAEYHGDHFYEKQVSFEKWVPGGFGTADHIVMADGVCHVVDFKHGKGVEVSAQDNAQLKLYAAGVLSGYDLFYDIDSFELHIVQPRIGNIDRWSISKEDLLAWLGQQVVPAAQKALCSGATMAAGSWCKFCKLRRECRVRTDWMVAQLAGTEDFASIEEGLDIVEENRMDGTITTQHYLRILDSAALIRGWLDDLEHAAVLKLMAGEAVGDWKLVEGRSNRAWALPDVQMASVLAEAGMTDEQMYTKKLLGPSKVEKLIGKKHRILATHVTKPPGKPKLAPGSDRRPAMTLDAIKDLGPLDEDNAGE